MRTRPLAEQGEQLVALSGGQMRLTAGMPFGSQASLTVLGTGIPPATDGPGRRLHLADAQAEVQQGQRHPTTNFELLFGACGSHTHLIGTIGWFL